MTDYLMHYGVKGMKWGIQNGPPYPLASKFDSPKSMSNTMKKWKYKDYSRLQSPEETFKNKSGSCHDQVIFEMQELRRMGYKPKATFVIEHDGAGQGGMTHSYVHYKNPKTKKIVYFENAWGGHAGTKEFSNAKEIREYFRKKHKSGEFGNSKRYSKIEFADFSDSDHEYGEDLQQFVDRCFDHNNRRNSR